MKAPASFWLLIWSIAPRMGNVIGRAWRAPGKAMRPEGTRPLRFGGLRHPIPERIGAIISKAVYGALCAPIGPRPPSVQSILRCSENLVQKLRAHEMFLFGSV